MNIILTYFEFMSLKLFLTCSSDWLNASSMLGGVKLIRTNNTDFNVVFLYLVLSSLKILTEALLSAQHLLVAR